MAVFVRFFEAKISPFFPLLLLERIIRTSLSSTFSYSHKNYDIIRTKMALTLTASTVVASVKPTVSSNRRYVDVVCARISRRWLRSFFLDESGKMWAIRAFFNGIPLCAALETNGWSESSLSLSLSLSALLQMRTTRLCVTRAQSSFACTASFVRARS